MNELEILKQISEFKQVPTDQLQWILDNGTISTIKQGEYLFKKGSPMDKLLIILEGHFMLKFEQGGNYRVVGDFGALNVTGLLPYSRAKEAIGYGEATESSRVLSLEASHFNYMKTHCDELTTALVQIMSSRIRNFTRSEQQNEKMMALGKLSAGLAHELNNPSSAVVRSAQSLNKHLRTLPDRFKAVLKVNMSDEVIDEVNGLLFRKIDAGIQHFSMMEKSAREDELLDWLETINVSEADTIAENLAAFDFTEDDLDHIAELMKEEELGALVHWLNQALTTDRLVSEIEEASKRINELVSSIKSYTHMDQAPDKKPADIQIGLENTLTMLNHKIKKSNITIIRNFDQDLPQPNILVSAMNQVWTNLIDNAIDAMEKSENKQLTITTKRDGDFINVDIEDSGSGIPDAIKNKIFDPFFTTKEIGKGTGLGLEVVHQIITQQHNGSINVDSEPGSTKFKVCFPINS